MVGGRLGVHRGWGLVVGVVSTIVVDIIGVSGWVSLRRWGGGMRAASVRGWVARRHWAIW